MPVAQLAALDQGIRRKSSQPRPGPAAGMLVATGAVGFVSASVRISARAPRAAGATSPPSGPGPMGIEVNLAALVLAMGIEARRAAPGNQGTAEPASPLRSGPSSPGALPGIEQAPVTEGISIDPRTTPRPPGAAILMPRGQGPGPRHAPGPPRRWPRLATTPRAPPGRWAGEPGIRIAAGAPGRPRCGGPVRRPRHPPQRQRAW